MGDREPKAKPTSAQDPARYRRYDLCRVAGQEECQARGPKGPARCRYCRCQAKEEGGRRQEEEGQRRPQKGRPQGRRAQEPKGRQGRSQELQEVNTFHFRFDSSFRSTLNK